MCLKMSNSLESEVSFKGRAFIVLEGVAFEATQVVEPPDILAVFRSVCSVRSLVELLGLLGSIPVGVCSGLPEVD